MTTDVIEILTPVGRLVQGNPFVANTKDQQGNPLVHKTGPNVGQPKVNYFCAIAISKSDPGLADMWKKIQTAAQQGFPRGEYGHPNFAWKFIDGDALDKNGQPHALKEGFKGCYVFRFQSSFAPKCYTAGGESLLTDPESIKRGYYIRIYGTTTGNGNFQNPGIYLNLSMVELIGYGEEIKSGPDGAAVFGGAPAGALPPGASAVPIAPRTPMAMPGMPPAPQAQGGYPMPPAPPAQGGYPMPQTAVAPTQVGMPPAQAGYPMPPAQGGYPMPQTAVAPTQVGMPPAQGGYPMPPAQAQYPNVLPAPAAPFPGPVNASGHNAAPGGMPTAPYYPPIPGR